MQTLFCFWTLFGVYGLFYLLQPRRPVIRTQASWTCISIMRRYAPKCFPSAEKGPFFQQLSSELCFMFFTVCRGYFIPPKWNILIPTAFPRSTVFGTWACKTTSTLRGGNLVAVYALWPLRSRGWNSHIEDSAIPSSHTSESQPLSVYGAMQLVWAYRNGARNGSPKEGHDLNPEGLGLAGVQYGAPVALRL